jgi:hypothetical protein
VKLQVKLLKKSNHGQAGDVVRLQDETATLLIALGLAELEGEEVIHSDPEPEPEETEEDDSGDESGETDVTE